MLRQVIFEKLVTGRYVHLFFEADNRGVTGYSDPRMMSDVGIFSWISPVNGAIM